MRVKINGKLYSLDRLMVEKKTSGVAPEIGRRFFIAIDGQRYPLKQVLAAATDLPAVALSTNQAFNILNRLGFEILDAEAQCRG